jgi:hypothetical protein
MPNPHRILVCSADDVMQSAVPDWECRSEQARSFILFSGHPGPQSYTNILVRILVSILPISYQDLSKKNLSCKNLVRIILASYFFTNILL